MREITCKIQDMVLSEELDASTVLDLMLCWLSESEVAEFAESELDLETDEDEDDEDE